VKYVEECVPYKYEYISLAMSFVNRVLSHKQDRLEQNGFNMKSLLRLVRWKSSLTLSD